MAWTKNVFSSMVSEVGWEEESSSLLITWSTGKKGAYADVPEEVAVRLSNAASVGTMINEEIKPNFKYRKA